MIWRSPWLQIHDTCHKCTVKMKTPVIPSGDRHRRCWLYCGLLPTFSIAGHAKFHFVVNASISVLSVPSKFTRTPEFYPCAQVKKKKVLHMSMKDQKWVLETVECSPQVILLLSGACGCFWDGQGRLTRLRPDSEPAN